MYALPAYLLAVLTASVVIPLEFLAVSISKDLIAGKGFSLDPFRDGLLAGVFLLPFIVFFFAIVISVVPFAYFQSAYKQLNGTAAKYAAILFGVAVAFFGFEVMGQLLPPFPRHDHLAAALLSIAPGTVSGWVFHRTKKLSSEELTAKEDS
ncbi:hypothetical protein LB542_04425 [Mesorhizobium sp. BR1-1-9]|uniref:hypothetical protein n=1 Tax=unclassified Mesorhizobium TaxID=325217 RepID=UPI00112BC4CD|nr:MULTISPECIES: hypothetical protein [unclassified Mesorhizobium]MBZ9809443.1 hypothetical protein [Mesorhizobium sp. ESP-6-2]MBZ9870108.1 hypothetical protein [Mesorhizobium sp. BR1-1-9]MBZ9943897.1 hypothetical protein [Mesorhizobium sp. BR1-1-13]TPM29081.1 hypothetical protein FJ955_15440 [Mesorhizobium sp. B2-2-2]